MNKVQKYYQERSAQKKESLLWQVGKTVDGKEVPLEQLNLVTDSLSFHLDLSSIDIVLDGGCGNGLLTKSIASKVCNMFGLDCTKELIDVAKTQSSNSNITYICQDLLALKDGCVSSDINKFYMYEVVQHLSFKEVSGLVSNLFSVFPRLTHIYIGGILDADKKWDFLNSTEKRFTYYRSLMSESNLLGEWYHQDFFRLIADELSVNCKIISQNPDLYTSYYRYDCLIYR